MIPKTKLSQKNNTDTKKTETQQSVHQSKKADNTEFTEHIVAKRQTLFAISRKYDISQDELKKLPKDDFTKATNLFNLSKDLHNAYYGPLIEQLSITGKILDADGD